MELNPAGADRLEEEDKIFSLKPGEYGGTLSWFASPKNDKEHTDGIMAEDAEWVLERCAKQKDRPFFLAVGFFRPHTPYVAPKNYFELYPENQMPVVQNIQEDQADIPAPGLGSHKVEQDKLTDELRRQTLQAYLASISFMDTQVGRVIDALDRLGLSDNTIIVFTSDHGYHMGEHGLWQKMSLFEESARVPMLIVAPHRSGNGTVARSPVSHIDLFPTLAELCSVKPPSNIQGQSLVPMLRDPGVQGRGWAITQVMRGGGPNRASVSTNVSSEGPSYFGYSLRTARWRYTEWDEGRKGRELYDHDNDAHELTNLAEKAEHAKTVAELSQQLKSAAKATFPPSGETPALKPGIWAPNLTEP
jgi:iduronate 2-sulfatase